MLLPLDTAEVANILKKAGGSLTHELNSEDADSEPEILQLPFKTWVRKQDEAQAKAQLGQAHLKEVWEDFVLVLIAMSPIRTKKVRRSSAVPKKVRQVTW